MSTDGCNRRDFLQGLLAGLCVTAIDWSVFPSGVLANTGEDSYDALVIGSGLGGLSCAAAFARQGFKPLVLEKHTRAGGYATTFRRPGGFVFDASLHSTSVNERDGVFNLIPGFPEISEVEFIPLKHLYRAIYPDFDFRVAQQDTEAYSKQLIGFFPEEAEGIKGLFADMRGVTRDIRKLSQAGDSVDMSRFPFDFPDLFKCYTKTWGQMMDERINDPRLRAVVSTLWGYYGLPPSRLSGLYYALPTIGYLEQGGYYPRGKSQTISDAFVHFIEERGGQVKTGTEVTEIIVENNQAKGVRTADGKEYRARVVVSNANAYDTFHRMMKPQATLTDYLARMDTFTASLSSFQVFLGLKKDLVRELGLTDTEIFYESGYDIESGYQAALSAKMDNSGYGLTLYDNVYDGYSPEGKNTLNIVLLQGYDHWQSYEADYFAGRKDAYRAEKERMADILIDRVESTLMPGLREAIEVRETGTPLTNVRYTGNYRGAIYGWDQTLGNSGRQRVGQTTPIDNLYLSGAWTSPGGGYTAVIMSGLQCFGEIMKKW